eukprot:490202-Alexandrium_andersonii.AAC.1
MRWVPRAHHLERLVRRRGWALAEGPLHVPGSTHQAPAHVPSRHTHGSEHCLQGLRNSEAHRTGGR